MMVPNFFYSNSYHFLNFIIIIITIIIILIIILIFLRLPFFLLGGKATEPNIFQHFKAKFGQHYFS